jgi:hypothetical protein
MSEIEFDPAKHEYRVAGVIVPSVTRILGDLSMMKRLDPADLAAGAERGKLVHKAVELYNAEDLDEQSLHPSLEPYLRAWKRFCHDHGFEALHSESIVYSERWGYAGTLDTIGTWKQMRKRPLVLLDVKTGVRDPVHGPQTAAYVGAAKEMGLLDAKDNPQRACVYLQPNGYYQCDPCLEPSDWSIFQAALHCYHFKGRHGII